jgi:hypothetical protein
VDGLYADLAGSLPGVCSGLQTAEDDDSQSRIREGTAMYQPALRPDQITRLYYLKLQRRKPMTRLLREAVDQYLHAYDEELEQLVKEAEATLTKRRQ